MRILALAAAFLLTGVTMGNAADTPQSGSAHSGHEGAVDFLSLFAPDAPWQKAAARIQAFQINDELIYDGSYSDDALRRMFADLRRRGMDLVIEMGTVTGQPGKCGYNVEGYGLPDLLRGDAARMKSLGAEPRYFTMDEPLVLRSCFRSGWCESWLQVANQRAGRRRRRKAETGS